jgi:hypothetical protein
MHLPLESIWDTVVAVEGTLTVVVMIVTTITAILTGIVAVIVTATVNAIPTLAVTTRTTGIGITMEEIETGATAGARRPAAATLLTIGGVEATLGVLLVAVARHGVVVTITMPLLRALFQRPTGSLVGNGLFVVWPCFSVR